MENKMSIPKPRAKRHWESMKQKVTNAFPVG